MPRVPSRLPSPPRPAAGQILTGAAAGLVAALAVDGLRTVLEGEERRQGRVPGRSAGRPARTLPGGRWLRYGIAALLGATYGTAAEMRSQTAMKVVGLAFGVSLAQTMEQGTLPAPALRDEPYRYRITFHLYGLVSHIVYALTAETLRRATRRR